MTSYPSIARKVRFDGNVCCELLGALELPTAQAQQLGRHLPRDSLACYTGKEKSVEALLKLGADPEIGEKDGYTCLHGTGFQVPAP